MWLTELFLDLNQLSGSIPASLFNCTNLHFLDLSSNQLSGIVPMELGKLTQLQHLILNENQLVSGSTANLPILTVLTNCSTLQFLDLGANHLTGRLPFSIGCLSREINFIRLSYNGLSGEIPLEIGNLTSLTSLDLVVNFFKKECKVLGRVRHRNLIRVITSYSDLQMKALIFPFMPNGSLEKWLYPDGEVESGLTLIQRLNIAIDIAQGMAYLHHHCFMQVIHCDLKPNNVLLGEDMTAYLIDFGIATICFANDEDSTFTSTLALKGSTGYIPPEYGLGGRVTTKGDVYSYGIVLLEMLTGKKPTHNMFVEGMNLQKWVGSSFPNQLGEVVDNSLLRMTSTSTQAEKDLNCLSESISMGLLCTKDSPEGRPTMMDIVGRLQSIRDTFLGVVGIPKSQSNLTCLLGDASIAHNNTSEGQSSSTF